MISKVQVFGVAAVLALASACTGDGAETLLILQNVIPGMGCDLDSTEGVRANGVVDTNSDLGYLIAPTIRNVATTENNVTAERRTVFIQGANVEIFLDTNLVPEATQAMLRESAALRFSREFTAPVTPNGGETTVGFEAIPKSVLEYLAMVTNGENTAVTVRVQVFGNLGNTTVESAPFAFPVDVCTNCLKDTLPTCVDVPADVPSGFNCSSPGAVNGERLQDERLLCCMSGGVERCPAAPDMMN